MMADSEMNEKSEGVVLRSWEHAHQMLVGFARTRAGLDLEEGQWLLAAARERVDRRLGFASFVEYVERLFGYAPRLTQEKLRVAEALEDLPELAEALRKAETCWSSIRELTRVATPNTERRWLDAAHGRTVRDVERLVSGRARGSLPTDPADESLRRHVLRFEVSGEALATFREATTKIRRDAGGALDDDAVLLLMARHVLHGPLDEGRSSYQIELSVCEDCQRARQQAAGDLIEVPVEIADMARCDAQHLSQPHVGAEANVRKAAKQDIPPALRRQVLRRDRRRCQAPGCRHGAFVDLHHVHGRVEGGQHEADNLVTLCAAHHRAAHEGELRVEGRVSTGLSFRHADGSEYGAVSELVPAVIDRQAKVFQALKQLGFGEREARQAVAETASQLGAEGSVEAALRAALERLTAAACRQAS